MEKAPLDYDPFEFDQPGVRKKVSCAVVAALVGFAAMLWIAGMVMLFLALTDAHAHDAPKSVAMPDGWSYPLSCCSLADCRQVSDAAITEGPNGYVINRTGEVIPMTDKKVRMSPDGLWHWCSQGGRDDSKTICLFTPGRGS